MKKLALSTVLLLSSATMSQAEIFFGGYLTLEHDSERFTSGPPAVDYGNIRGETLIGYQNNNFTIAGGLSFTESDHPFGSGIEIDHEDLFGLVSFNNITLTFGHFYGAGNVVSEDYFGLDDVTSEDDDTLRVDYDGGKFHVAASYSFEAEEWELGLSTKIGDQFIRAGYESDSEELFVLTGREFGNWGYHLAGVYDFDFSGAPPFLSRGQIGATLLYNFNSDFSVAANVAFDVDQLDLHSYGIIGWYEFGSPFGSLGQPTLRIEYVEEILGQPFEFKSIEVSLVIPFGKSTPAGYERQPNKEEFKNFGFF